MNATKKSKFKQLTKFKNVGTNKSREAGERNKVWHTAELAAALYQTGQLEEGEGERDGEVQQRTPSTSSQNLEEEVAEAVLYSAPITKRTND